MYRYRVEYLKEEQTRNLLVSEHEELVKAIREGDVQKAQDISFHHLENQRKAIIRTIRAENEAKEAEEKRIRTGYAGILREMSLGHLFF